MIMRQTTKNDKEKGRPEGLLHRHLRVLDFDPQPGLSSLRDGTYGFRVFGKLNHIPFK
jgi:hypothetical protein